MNVNELNGAALAYLGDAVIGLMTREYLIGSGMTDVGKMNAEALKFVSAPAQSAAVGLIIDLFTEDEAAVYHRGRNMHGISAPRSSSVLQYRRASGMEALFASLYIEGKTERMRELFTAAYRLGEQE